MSVFTFVIGIMGLRGLKIIDHSAEEILAEAVEIDDIQELRVSLHKLIMPANDYLVHGKNNEVDKFDKLLIKAEEEFVKVKNIEGDPLESSNLAGIDDVLRKIKELSGLIFALDNPVGNAYGAALMEQMDSLIDKGSADLDKVLDIARVELDEYISVSEKAERDYSRWIVLFTIGLTGSGLLTAILITKGIVNNLERLTEASEAVSRGDLTQNIRIGTRDEIGQLSDSFNHMIKNMRTSRDDQLAEKTYSDSIISSMTDSLIVVDNEGLIRTVNKASLDLLGFTENELVGQPVSNIFEEEEILNDMEEVAMLISKDLKIIKVNDAFLRSTGFKRKDVINKQCHQIMRNSDVICGPPHDTCPINENISRHDPGVELHTHFDSKGNSFPVNVIAVPIKGRSGDVDYYLHLYKKVETEAEKGQISAEYMRKIDTVTDKLESAVLNFEGEKIFSEGAVEKLMKSEAVTDLEMFYRTRWGGIIPVRFSGSLIKDKDGKAAGIIGVARDMRQMNKYIEDEKKLAVATAEAQEGLKKALELEEAYHELESSKDAALNIMEDLDEQARKLQQEVAERREAEGKLRKAYQDVELLADLVENAHEIVLIANPDGEIFENNAMTRHIFGYSDEEMQRLKMTDLFRVTKLSGWKKVSESIRRESYWRGELTAICRNGREFPADVTVSRPGGTKTEKDTKIICFVRDVTEEKEIDRMKNEFISTVSHELRTPLSITKEGISLVLDRIPGEINKQQEELLGTALNNIDRLARIINGLLDISKIEARKIELKREGVDIISVINQVMSSFAQKLKSQGLELRTSFPDNSLQVYMDEDKTVQIFTNIISNSLKFTGKGFIGISVKEKNDKVECVISDSGKGISKDDMPKLFSKFQQFGRTAGPGEKGTGLGLSIVKNLVDLQGGEIEVRSDLDKGTIITVVLPKYTVKNILKENVLEGIRNASQTGESYSLLLIEMSNFHELEKKVEKREADKVFRSLLNEVKKLLRRNCDVLVEDHSDIFVLLPQTEKESSLIVLGRIKKTLEDNIMAEGITVFKDLKINIRGVSYPNDADTFPDMLNIISEVKNG